MDHKIYHNPVLLKESIDALIISTDGIYVDCTFGGGGHSKEILKRLSPKGKLFAFDQDYEAINNKVEDERLILIHQNFRYLTNYLQYYSVNKVDGILADLGVSSHQIDAPRRGFSTRFEGLLDMRMNQGQDFSALEIINSYEEGELIRVFNDYGEIYNPRKIVKDIIRNREKGEIQTTEQLKSIFDYIPQFKRNKFFARLFQALRIEVNDELGALKDLLVQSEKALKENGVLVFISYHSLEDRLVKKYFKSGNFIGEPQKDIYGNWDPVFKTGKAIVPSTEEVEINPRARSAKMRIAIKNEKKEIQKKKRS